MNFEDVCIICLENMDRKDAVWSCSTCYSDYHLVCINDWISKHRKSREQILMDEQRHLNLSEGHEMAIHRVNKLMQDTNHWSCPKCRHEYPLDEAPNQYYCYCGKTSDPKGNNWLKPHTCGEKCGKFLKPYCGDVCYDLCHWGPCQPCPKMLSNSFCFCGKQSRNAIRCSQRFWSCESVCNKELACGLHFCEKLCHEKNCAPCESLVNKTCLCQLETKVVKCSETWKCSKGCKTIDKSLLNKCQCGKKAIEDLASGDGYRQLTCTDTCDKLLDCGVHKCVEKCHIGDCSLCRQMVTKSCKCGSSVAMVMCHKELTCNTKCVRWKSCGKHQCKRRCCDPNSACSPCELICNNTLSCRKHRCQMRCHIGPCYPCQKTVDVSCSCGSTLKRVACGAKTGLIGDILTYGCKNPCKIPSRCRHENSHKCHSKEIDCPPCTELCRSLQGCGHECSRQCHDAVKTTLKLDKSKLAGPWEAANDGKVTFVSLECPPCDYGMSLICFGSHELLTYPCWQKLPYSSCGRPCGRLLSCGNHSCNFECHQTSESKNPLILLGDKVKITKSGLYCNEPCNKLCERPLMKNSCKHQCPKITCHNGPCPPCTRYMIRKCHCGSLDLHIECHNGPNPPPAMLSCPARCTRYLTKTCNHQCPNTCHPGKCEDLEGRCKAKVNKTCPCGQKKYTFPCWKGNTIDLSCDPMKCDMKIEAECGVTRRRNDNKTEITTKSNKNIRKSFNSLIILMILVFVVLFVVWNLFDFILI